MFVGLRGFPVSLKMNSLGQYTEKKKNLLMAIALGESRRYRFRSFWAVKNFWQYWLEHLCIVQDSGTTQIVCKALPVNVLLLPLPSAFYVADG